jgi:hypothetical protein
MKLRIKNAKAGLARNKPCIVFELNKYDLEKAEAYNGRDLTGYTVEIVKQKRSNDQNRYMWELISQIAERSGLRPNDIYRHAIREAGKYIDMKIIDRAYTSFCKMWADKGVGWWVETERQDNGEVFCRAYCGTSAYNSKEMSNIIDWVIEEAVWYDIETETPEQLERRKAQWNGEV